jgi:PAS domain S-box-containing protein
MDSAYRFSATNVSLIALLLMATVGMTALLLLPRRHHVQQYYWIASCLVLAAVEALRHNAGLAVSGMELMVTIGSGVVSFSLARRIQILLQDTTPRERTMLNCAGLAVVPMAATALGLVGPPLLVLRVACLVAASCWPLLSRKTWACVRAHSDRFILFALLLGYASLVLCAADEPYGGEGGMSLAEVGLNFFGVMIGFAATLTALRGVVQENERLVNLERAANLAQGDTTRLLRALVDGNPAAVYVKDLEGRYTLVNHVATTWSNRTEANMLGRTDAELFPASVADSTREHDRLVLASGRQDNRELSLKLSEDGAARSLINYKFPLFDGAGKIVAIAGLAVDITAQKSVERDLLKARHKAEEANRAKSNFLAHMSHELRTPLNAIIGFSEVIHTSMFGAEQHELYRQYAGDIQRAGKLLLTQVNDLLDVSRIEAGDFEVKAQVTNLGPVAEECCRLLRDQAARAGLTLAIDWGRPLPQVVCDRRATLQVLLNLVGNAIKYVPKNCTITVAGGRTESGVDYFMVEDNGPGLPSNVLQALLDPWTHQSAVVTEDGRGGMGLMLSRKLMEAQGGRMFVESSPGKGTRIACQFMNKAASDAASQSTGN